MLVQGENLVQWLSALSGSGGGGTPAHNDTTAKQGGATDEYYHLTEAEYLALGGVPDHNDTGAKQGGTTDEYYHLTAAQHADNAVKADLSRGANFAFPNAAIGQKIMMSVSSAATLSRYTILADASGSVTFSVKKSTYAAYPGSLADITGGANAVITTAQKAQDSTLTGWTTALADNDCVEVEITALTTATNVTLCLKADK